MSKGANVEIGNRKNIIVPWHLVGAARWNDYEPITTKLFANLIEEQPTMAVVDIGSAIGIYSLIGLSVSRQSQVYSMDSDLMSLAITREMGRATGADRHHFIRGFCSNTEMARTNPLRADLDGAARATNEVLNKANLRPKIGANKYTCIDLRINQDIPFWDVDGLFLPMAKTGRPMLIKCDIEGAEKLMLEGAQCLMDEPNVQLLLSIHPTRLLGFGTTKENLWKMLEEKSFDVKLVDTDCEEHWWARKK